jgi:phage terminase large subunit-like protein
VTTALLDPEAEWRSWSIEDKTRLRWRLKSRPKQRPPEGDWNVWLILTGRGWGKTETGANWLAGRAWDQPNSRWAVVAPTFGQARDVCVEGETGLLAALANSVKLWNRSEGLLILRNDSRIKCFSGDEPDRLRGPQHHGAWCDELASWRYSESWDQLMFGLRLGDKPRIVATTTPQPTKLIRGLRERAGADVHLTMGSTFENAENLAPAALEQLKARYEGTRLGRQELYAEILSDVEGALWKITDFEREGFRVTETPDFDERGDRIVVAVDPAVTSGEDADETGIIVAGRVKGGNAYVLDDLSDIYDPTTAMHTVIDAYHDAKADKIIVERNNGSDYIPALARTIDDAVPIETVWATRGKALRAEPIQGLYQQQRVHHLGTLPKLEEQMVSWTPDSTESPDRLDALVYALVALFPELPKGEGRRLGRVW